MSGRHSDAISLVVSGFNYQAPPVILRDGARINPFRSSFDYRAMTYYFDLFAPNGWNGHMWQMETMDMVTPSLTVYDLNRKQSHPVANLSRRQEGHYLWNLDRTSRPAVPFWRGRI